MSDLEEQVRAWLDGDPDPATRAELSQLSPDELAERFTAPLSFGTAGLRGPVRAGPNGMNVAVVIRTTAGLAHWLQTQGLSGGVVVLGRDGRHGSAAFAAAATRVLVAAGFDVRTFTEPVPTPLVAFAVRAWEAVAGVQITASHNPAGDNGYKVYLSGGAQLIPPSDEEIEAAIAAVGRARDVPRATPAPGTADDVVETYLERVASLPYSSARALRVALTPMHGVGGAIAVEGLRRAGFTDVHVVASQAEPDADFPTVRFPNPEEPGACDALLALAAEVDADVAIALDPDADRCAIGARGEDGWRMLRGDETGVLLGDYVMATTTRRNPLVASTIVSSQLLGKVAAARGVRHVQTLTGFKWLVRAGEGLVYAYEEAIGYCVDPDAVRDKDGISAAVLACDLAAGLKAAGRTLLDCLDDLALAHGLHAGGQLAIRVDDRAEIATMMARLRATLPSKLDSTAVEAQDLLPRTDAVVLHGADVRVVVRPSGTEPKLKCYLEVVAAVTDRTALPAAREQAALRLARLREEMCTALGHRPSRQ